MKADLVLIQEHHLPARSIATEEQWCRRNSWRAALAPALEGRSEHGTSGGVGIATPAHRALANFKYGQHAGPELPPGRCTILHWPAVIKGGIAVASVYLVTAIGPTGQNTQLLMRLAEQLRMLGRPYIVGGGLPDDA